MKKLIAVIGLVAAALLAVPVLEAADPGKWDGPELKVNTNTIASLTNVSKTLFATNSLRLGIWLSSQTASQTIWAGLNRTNAAVGQGVKLVIDGTGGGLFLPVEKTGKGPFSIIGTNATNGSDVSGTELQLQR
jgi:hypothetical protein